MTVAVPDGTDQAGTIGPQAGNVVPQAEAAEEDAESASGVGNIVPRMVEKTEKIESAACVSSVGNKVPCGVKKTSTSAEVSLSTSRVDNQVPHSESETPPARSIEDQYHIFDGVSGRQVKAGAVHLEALPEMSALLNLEKLSMKDFLAELKAGEIAEMVLLKPETSPEDLNASSVMDEDVLMGFTKQRATRLGSEILTNPKDPVYPHIDLVPGTKYCVTRQWPLPREQCEAIDAFFVEKAKSGMILMRESDIPNTTVSTPSGMLWEWLVMSQGLSNTPVVFNRLVIQLFRPLRTFAQTYFDDIFIHNRAEGGQTAIEVHPKHLRRVFDVRRANKLYANIDKCVFAAEGIKVLGCFLSRVGVRSDLGNVKAIAA
ncbi:polyprotein [Phytophthora palmivora]|uniref:Polyprotein n=1 Tax=Phytophthora palmivora TaxID=4796 RepID=A0A2P4X4Y3_9STRA|nr:polyprotein [Phytophthora palmivora]